MNARFLYREAAVQGANPVRLVVLLYEQMIEDIRRALAALEVGDVEERTRNLNHAMLVLGYLEATLDWDRGGQVAQSLQRFYRQIRSSLVEAQCQQSAALLEQQIAFLMQVREAWSEVEHAEHGLAASPQTAPPPHAETLPHSEWKA